MDEVEVPEGEVGVVEAVEPEVFDVSEDGLFRLDADGDPIPGAELKSGWLRQSDYTRKTQELAERQKSWEKRQQELETSAKQYQQQVADHYSRWAQQQVQAARQPAQDPRAAIWQKAEANGGIVTIDEAKLLDQQWSEAFQQQVAQNNRMLQAMGMLNSRVNEMQGPLTNIQSERQETQLTSRLNTFLDDSSIPKGEYRDRIGAFLKEWEPTPQERQTGIDLEDTWKGILSTFSGSTKEIEKSQAAAAVKGLGRVGGAAKPSKGVKGPQSIAEIVEATWRD